METNTENLDYYLIKTISKWPKVAKRNLRTDIAKPSENFNRLRDIIEYIDAHLNYLNNRNDEQKKLIYNKIFSSDHPTFNDVLNFVEEKQNLLQGGTAFTKEQLYKLVSENDFDLKIVYDKNNVVIVDVTGQSGIKAIGCNSLWCFTYGNEYGLAGEQWDRYSHNGHVYAIIDFKEDQASPEFIHILLKPFNMQEEEDQTYLYDMANEQTYGDARNTILYITKDESSLDVFKFEDF